MANRIRLSEVLAEVVEFGMELPASGKLRPSDNEVLN